MDGQGLGSGVFANVQPLAGGSQNVLLRFTRAGRDYVLRRPPVHLRANSNETMRREARVLGALAGSEVPHPRLIAACPDADVLGAAFYLMEPITGFNPQNGLPASHHPVAIQHRMGLAVVEGLAALHGLDHAALGLADFGKAEGFLERQVARWGSQLDGYGELAGWPGAGELGDVTRVADWLESSRPDSFTPGVLHGDFHLANVMFREDGPELAAIIDWELATIGDPLIDLGWVLATWPQQADGGMLGVKPWNGFPASGELVRHYADPRNALGQGDRLVRRLRLLQARHPARRHLCARLRRQGTAGCRRAAACPRAVAVCTGAALDGGGRIMIDTALDFTGKRVLVVGGSSGIGNGMAQAFRARGAQVHVWGTRGVGGGL